MKKLLLLLTVCLFIFTGCKKDENETKSLVGTWATEEDNERMYDKYNADGTGEAWFVYNGKKEDVTTFKYNYNSEKNIITYTYSDETIDMKVVDISENVLTLKFENEPPITYYKQ